MELQYRTRKQSDVTHNCWYFVFSYCEYKDRCPSHTCRCLHSVMIFPKKLFEFKRKNILKNILAKMCLFWNLRRRNKLSTCLPTHFSNFIVIEKITSHSVEIFKAAVSSIKYLFMKPVYSVNLCQVFQLSCAASEIILNLLKAVSVWQK